MNINLLRKLNLAVLAFFCVISFSKAQPFIPDKAGYVDNPKFLDFMKARGYELVGTFNVIQEKPLIAYAKVLKDGKWSTMDTYGKVVLIAPAKETTREIKGDRGDDSDEFDPFHYVHPSNAGLQIIQKDGKYGLVNTKSGKDIIPAIYDEVRLTNFKFVAVRQNDKWGTITKQGQNAMPPQYDEIKSLGVNMAHTSYITGDAVVMRSGSKWGLLSDEGKEIVGPQYDKIESSWVVSSLLIITAENKKGLLNKAGRELCKPIYTKISNFNNGGTAIVNVGPFNSLLYGLVDSLGIQVIKPVYKNIYYLGQTTLAVYEEKHPNAKIGLFNTKGEQLTKPVYKGISNFNNNLALITVSENGHDKRGYIDSTGREVIKPEYDELTGVAQHIYEVKKDDKYGVIDANGKVLVPLKYEGSFIYDMGLIRTMLEGRRCTIDLYGNEHVD